MFAELVELGKRVYKGHDALETIKCSWDIVIDEEGHFIKLIPCDVSIEAEKLPAKKGRARLLLDKPLETLGIDPLKKYDNNEEPDEEEKNRRATEKKEWEDENKKHTIYIAKLEQYRDVAALNPVFAFYEKPHEVNKARAELVRLSPKKQDGNMTFMVNSSRIVGHHSLKEAIKNLYETELAKANSNNVLCAVCGTKHYPILDESHGSVKMPKGQTSGSMLVSYNTNAFESYCLKGNLNSGICTNCARNYIEALRFLLTNGHESINEKGEAVFKYSNRQRISDDTVALFWTKEPVEDVASFSDICLPTEERVKRLFSAVITGDAKKSSVQMNNFFYCCTLSSAAARIAVRDWMAISISQYQHNIKQWFEDIETIKDGEKYYPGLNTILNNCIKKKSKLTQSDYKAKARVGVMLWHAALANASLPIMILQSVLSQIEHGFFSVEQSTVIRLVLNRNIKNKYKMKNVLDNENERNAYLCGRLFALVCKLQFLSQGSVNNSIKDRFFASASNAPARVMGLLLTKYVPIYEKKTKGAYSKAITEIAARIEKFPEQFTATERGEFALGYYYQYNAKQADSTNE